MIIREIQVKDIITKSNLPVCDYSLNPYVGCEHGCRYCYACFMKRFTGHEEKWGEFIDVKYWKPIARPEKYAGKEIFIGSVTDPYQPCEEKYKRTRAVLEQLQGSGAKLSIATKSDLILRDLDLIKSFPNARVSWSINTLDEDFREDMDNAVSIERRLAAMKTFHGAGVRTTCFISPIFPEITDVKAIIERAKDNCNLIWLENLNLRGTFKPQIMEYIARKYPRLLPLYRDIYTRGDNGYWQWLDGELPEVETVRRVLEPHLLKKKITGVQIHNAQVIASPSPEQFIAGVTGQGIAAFTRRGKFLRLLFESGDSLTVHLRMTGCLTIEPQTMPSEKHTHVIFTLNDGNELRYEDVRRLGKLWFAKSGEEDVSGVKELGMEPFDSALNAAYLRGKCKNSKKPVKSMLLDQSIVAGIGNIYSDEILFAAGIRPDRACNSLTDSDFERLAAAIPERLNFFIEKKAISFEEYALSKGKDYRNTPYLQVYGKAGEPCPVCGKGLHRIVLGGRSSVFCPHCQI